MCGCGEFALQPSAQCERGHEGRRAATEVHQHDHFARLQLQLIEL